MLVLRRISSNFRPADPRESDVVLQMPDGRQILVRVTESSGRYVRLGVEAPDDVVIMRAELEDEPPAEEGQTCPQPPPSDRN